MCKPPPCASFESVPGATNGCINAAWAPDILSQIRCSRSPVHDSSLTGSGACVVQVPGVPNLFAGRSPHGLGYKRPGAAPVDSRQRPLGRSLGRIPPCRSERRDRLRISCGTRHRSRWSFSCKVLGAFRSSYMMNALMRERLSSRMWSQKVPRLRHRYLYPSSRAEALPMNASDS